MQIKTSENKKKRLTFSEGLNLLNLAVGVIIGIVTALLTIWGIKSNETIAQRSGALDKGEIQLTLAGSNFSKIENKISVGSSFGSGEVEMVQLPFQVQNLGKKSVDDIYVVFRYPQLFHMMVDASLVDVTTPLDNFTRKTKTIAPYNTVVYYIKSLNPGVTMILNEPVLLRETRISGVVNAKTKDNVKLKIPYSMEYGLKFDVSLTAKDVQPFVSQFSISAIKATTIDDLINKVIANIEHNIKPHPEPGFWQTLLTSRNINLDRAQFLMIPAVQQIGSHKEMKLLTGKVTPEEIVLIDYTDDAEYAFIERPNKDPELKTLTSQKKLHRKNQSD